MRLETDSGHELWLAYGMNVHAGGDARTLRGALDTFVPALRTRLDAKGPFGLAVRLSAGGVEQLRRDEALRDALRERLDGERLVVFTGNAFVFGDFHGRPLKDEVYRPPWGDPTRTAYTLDFAEVLAVLNETGARCSLSTSPGAWRAWERQPAVADRAREYAECAEGLRTLHDRTGVHVQLAIEPEPRCSLETTDEAIGFFEGPLSDALRRLHPGAAEHVGLCYDVCHQAVVHEDIASSLQALQDAGIPIAKLQASCALEVPHPDQDASRIALERFDEPTYLHQVGARDAEGNLHAAEDLSAVLGDAAWRAFEQWRVHFHVPVFRRAAVPPLRTTRDDLDTALRFVVEHAMTEQIEIETYTWDVLPEAEREAGSGFDLVEALHKEYVSVLEVLETAGVSRAGVGT